VAETKRKRVPSLHNKREQTEEEEAVQGGMRLATAGLNLASGIGVTPVDGPSEIE
jgi:hypothetical protein